MPHTVLTKVELAITRATIASTLIGVAGGHIPNTLHTSDKVLAIMSSSKNLQIVIEIDL